MARDKAKAGGAAGTLFEAVIGLEVHVQLKTRTKMFCGCENRFGAEPNSLTCPVCLGHPGSLPAINKAAIEHAVRVGLACGCEVARTTKFDRKNYYYPDLPKNYQISQYDMPICRGGRIEMLVGGKKQAVGLTRIHLEEDAGKNIHVEGKPESWVDLNRAGVPLLEIVSEPELRTPEEAGAYLRMLRLTLLYLGASDCNMEEGSLRCDSNVSVRPRGLSRLETRTEIKNVNSFTNVENALSFEIQRQIRIRQGGGEVVQQTLQYDPVRGETRVMRGKEEAHDYRYFPEPDLAPLHLDDAWIDGIKKSLPELPVARFERYRDSLGLSPYHADVLLRDLELAEFFEECVRAHYKPQEMANWVLNSCLEEMNSRGVKAREVGISPSRLAGLVKAIEGGQVSRQKARDVFKAMLAGDEPAASVIQKLGLGQISDDSLLEEAVRKVIAAHPEAVADVREGKKNSFNFLMGQVMRSTRGQGNPAVISKIIEDLIRGGA